LPLAISSLRKSIVGLSQSFAKSTKVREFFTYFDSGEKKKMKKLSLSIVTVLVFFVATAMAQTTPAPDPTTTPTTASPSAPTPTPEAQAPAAQPGASTASTPAAGTQTAATVEPKGEKKLKGCIESENGKFVLENKHGKEITLIGQDVSAHVGHQVVLHGAFQNSAASASGETPGTAASTSSTSTDMKAKAGQEFNVTSVEMVASTCKDKDKAGEKHEKSTSTPPQ
jgi:glucose/arabinose dehydrogenase